MNGQTKDWWRVSIEVNAAAEEASAAMLEREFGQAPVVNVDFESKRTLVAIYVSQPPPNRSAVTARIRENLRQIAALGLDAGPGRVAIAKVRREDWRHSWKKHFQPFEVGRSLLIRPSWSQQRARRGQRLIVLDPGLSFGTGQHATTRYCLGAIAAASHSNERRSFLDIGTGTGILAIAAAKLGFRKVAALDLDPVAVRVAKLNARRNRVSCSITRADLSRLSSRSGNRFDLICANLIDTVLIKHTAKIVNRLSPQGQLVLAGILQSQFGPVTDAYLSRGLQLVNTAVAAGWQSATFAWPLIKF